MSQPSQKWARKTCAIRNSSNKPFLIHICGRELWALTLLLEAGATGCTANQVGAVRLAAYVHRLRERGVWIETVDEANGSEFPGKHARYVLHSWVCIDADMRSLS